MAMFFYSLTQEERCRIYDFKKRCDCLGFDSLHSLNQEYTEVMKIVANKDIWHPDTPDMAYDVKACYDWAREPFIIAEMRAFGIKG